MKTIKGIYENIKNNKVRINTKGQGGSLSPLLFF